MNEPENQPGARIQRQGAARNAGESLLSAVEVFFHQGAHQIGVCSRAVCFGSLAQRSSVSRATIQRFLKTVPEGCLKVFDINLRQHFYNEKIIRDSLLLCDILKINDEELVVVADMLGYAGLEQDVVCGHLRKDFGLQMVILTCGVRGSYIYYDGGMSFLGTPDSEVVDTVGAGDAFGGAFVRSILSGKSAPEAHQTAVDVSTWVCSCHGAMPKK